MSDVDLNGSPRSESASDSENPPTPGYDVSQDGDQQDQDEDADAKEVKEDEKEEESIPLQSPSDKVNDESDNEAGDRLVSDQEVEEIAAVSPALNEKSSSSPSASSAKDDNADQEESVDMEIEEEEEDKEDTAERSEEPDDSSSRDNSEEKEGKEEDNLLSEENAVEGTQTGEVEEEDGSNKKPNENDSSKGGSSSAAVDDGDLLQISDLSVDLTGDEAAIVEDILQNAGDGELIPSGGTAEEKPELDDSEEISGSTGRTPSKTSKDHDEHEEQVGGTGELLADIFGSSDEDEEFEGFEKDDLQGTPKSKKKKSKEKREMKPAIASDDEEEAPKPEGESQAESEAPQESLTVPPPQPESSDSEDETRPSETFVSDFDLMMERKKEEGRKSRRRRKVDDILGDNDDLIVGLIKRMKEAAEEDRLANEARQAATKKLVLLPTVLKHMLKIDLMVIFIDCNVLPVLKEWINPLPDGSLPHLQVREGVLKILKQLPPVDTGALKLSGIGKAVMFLFKHPKETRKNKELAGKLISEWSRPIFGVTANFKSMSREEREERDYANMSKRRRLSSDGGEGGKTPKRIENAIKSESKALRPGDKGWCMRARVPAPSNKDYVVRPKSNIDFLDFSKVCLAILVVDSSNVMYVRRGPLVFAYKTQA